MASVQPKNLVPVLILRILEDHSDEQHPLTREAMEDILYTEYGVTIERKAFFRHVENVRALYKTGPVTIRWKYIRPNPGERAHCKAYYLHNDSLSQIDLRVILDALAGSSYLSQSETDELSERLVRLCPRPLQKRAVSYPRIGQGKKTDNNAVLMNLEAIDKAIAQRKQVYLQMVHIKSDGRKVASRDRGQVCSPIQYFVSGPFYYLAGVCAESEGLRPVFYKLSNIASVEILDEPALDHHSLPEFKHGVNWNTLLREHPTLERLQDKPELCTFLCLRWQIDDLKRHFGDDLRIRELTDPEYEHACQILSGKMEKAELVEVSVITTPDAAAEFACGHTVGMWLTGPDEARKAANSLLRSRLNQWERLGSPPGEN